MASHRPKTTLFGTPVTTKHLLQMLNRFICMNGVSVRRTVNREYDATSALTTTTEVWLYDYRQVETEHGAKTEPFCEMVSIEVDSYWGDTVTIERYEMDVEEEKSEVRRGKSVGGLRFYLDNGIHWVEELLDKGWAHTYPSNRIPQRWLKYIAILLEGGMWTESEKGEYWSNLFPDPMGPASRYE